MSFDENSVALFAEARDQRQAVLENRRFHHLIAVRAGNPVFAHLVMALNWIIDGTPLGVHFPKAELRAAAVRPPQNLRGDRRA